MKGKVYSRQELVDIIRQVAEEADVEKAFLFGSYARGTATRRSDVDVVFIVQTDEPFFQRRPDILSELYRHLDKVSIEFLVYTPEEWGQMQASGNRFVRKILQEGIIVYERSQG